MVVMFIRFGIISFLSKTKYHSCKQFQTGPSYYSHCKNVLWELNEKMFNSVKCLTSYIQWLFLLFEYKGVWKSYVTICNQIVICSLLDFLKAGFHSLSIGFIKKSLCMLLFQCCGHLGRKNLLILDYKSVYRIFTLQEALFQADLVVKSFLTIPMWIGINMRCYFCCVNIIIYMIHHQLELHNLLFLNGVNFTKLHAQPTK